ncbi:MAG: hypothetical protein Q9M92_17860 [Enterobacterales bacterium]|nr:hypothetical protein [Enterobacterales bacterium]
MMIKTKKLLKTKRFTFGYLLIIAMQLLYSSLSFAEAVQANKQYLAGSVIEFPNHGVSFTLPSNVYGVLSPDQPESEFVAVLSDFAENGDNGIYMQLGQGNLEQMAIQMNGIMNFKGTPLNPISTTQKVDGAAYNEFEYSEKGKDYKTFMLMVTTSGNNAVLFVAASPENIYPSYKQAVINIAKSIQFNDPNSASHQTSTNHQHNQSPSTSVSANLSPDLIGAWMRRKNASNGIYIETTTKWVFSGDGAVAWGSGAVIAGGTAGVSLRGGGQNPPDYGRWSTEGETLRIQWNDGTQGEWTFSVFRDYNDNLALALQSAGSKQYFYRKID